MSTTLPAVCHPFISTSLSSSGVFNLGWNKNDNSRKFDWSKFRNARQIDWSKYRKDGHIDWSKLRNNYNFDWNKYRNNGNSLVTYKFWTEDPYGLSSAEYLMTIKYENRSWGNKEEWLKIIGEILE